MDPALSTTAAARRRSGIRTSCCALAPVKTSCPCLSSLCSVSVLIFFSRIFFLVRTADLLRLLQLPSFFLRFGVSSLLSPLTPALSPLLPSPASQPKVPPSPSSPFPGRSLSLDGRGKGEGGEGGGVSRRKWGQKGHTKERKKEEESLGDMDASYSG